MYSKKIGIQLGKTTYDQSHNGKAINKIDLQPGDLVFFGSSNDPYHVGIYVENNSYIHASKTGDIIKISDLNSRDNFLAARRII